jgi:4-carboxymuconolactone decarboxylase
MPGWVTEEKVDVKLLPRFGPISYADAGPRARQVYEELGRSSTDNVVLGTFMRNPDLTRVHSPFVSYMKNSTCLPVRHREIAILRSAWSCGADYQWEMHNEIGLECGLTQEEIDRIPSGAESPEWTTEEANVLRAVDELHSTCRVGDETWAGLTRQYDERQLVEFLVLVGNYRTIAYVMNGVGIAPPSGVSPHLPGNRFLFSSPEARPAEKR